MDEREKNLLIEVHVTADDGRQRNFTGYPVAPNRILTARHGLLPDVAAKAKAIEVRWHELEGEPRRWRPAKVVWEDGPLDAALLACEFPAGVTGFGWLSEQVARETNPPTRWASAGIARAGDKSKTESGSFDFHGNVYSAASNKLRFDIGVEDEASEKAYWDGSSGMPIFVERRIIGVAMSCYEATGPRRFKASPVHKMVRNPKFRKELGFDARKKRRDEARRDLVELLLRASEPAMKALGEATDVGTRDKENWARALADKLLETEIDAAIQSVYEAWDSLGRDCSTQDRTTLREVMGVVLPIVYDAGVIDCTRTRCSMPEAVLLELPAGIETVAEVIMAGVHGRPARFKPLRERDRFPEGADALSDPPESGFDSDGSAYERNVHTHLCNKLLACDESEFDAFMVSTFVKEAAAYRANGVKQHDLIRMVADELEERAVYDKRRFYFILKRPELTDVVVPSWLAAVENLKNRYRYLDFVTLGHASDGNIIVQERRRFGILRRMVPGAVERRP